MLQENHLLMQTHNIW